MSIQVLGDVVIGLALVVWICYRQMTWRPLAIGRMWRLPIILGIVGVVMLTTTTKTAALTGVDIAVLLIELVVSLGIGAIMGSLATIRPMSQQAIAQYNSAQADDRRGPSIVTMETRTGWFGAALWIVMILVRVGIDFFATEAGSVIATSTGVILIMIAANRIARVGILANRHEKLAQASMVRQY
jgi:uncharacterized membrane protein